MARLPRTISSTGYYHIILRGVDKMTIFYDEKDHEKFLQTVFRFGEETETKISAFCLMKNHVHLLVCSDEPALFVKKIGCSFVRYFNAKYDRIGPLFQDRYKSEPIEDEHYLLTVVRYIHMNPEKAGICDMEKYRWSSYLDFLSEHGRVDTSLILKLTHGVNGYAHLMRSEDTIEEQDFTEKITDDIARLITEREWQNRFGTVRVLTKPQKTELAIALYNRGLNIEQIGHCIGMSKPSVYRMLD